MTKERSVIGLFRENRCYKIGNVNYIVNTRFEKPEPILQGTNFKDRIIRIITGDFIPLTSEDDTDTMADENVCSTAGKED